MTGSVSKSTIIKNAILEELEKGIQDKQQIYDIIEKTMNVPRPTIRRVCRDLLSELKQMVKILEPVKPNGTKQKKE